MLRSLKDRLADGEVFVVKALRRANYLGRRRIPPGIRSLAGLLCMVGGGFGFLPILGYWMIPVGILLIALDIPVLRPAVRRWIGAWQRRVDGRNRTPPV